MKRAGGGDSIPPGTGDRPKWAVPASWTEVARSQFLVAKFRAAGEGEAKADINVSMSGGTDKSTYYVSLSAITDPGWTLASKLKRYTASFTLDHHINDKLSVNLKETLYGPASRYDSRTGCPLTTGTTLPTCFKNKIGSTFITDLEISYRIIEPVKLTIGANNLFNKLYPSSTAGQISGNVYGAGVETGRTVSATVRYKF